MILNRVGIDTRSPLAIHEFGYLEYDTFVSGKKTGSKAVVSVLIEPHSSYGAGIKIKKLKPGTNEQAIQTMLEEFKRKNSITRDNGI